MRYIHRARARAALGLIRKAARGAGALGGALRSRSVLAFLIGFVALLCYSGYITALNSFMVVDGGTVTLHKTYTTDSLLALKEAGIELGAHDVVSMPDEPVVGGFAEITIRRGLTATVEMDGREVVITSASAATVRDLLEKAGYRPAPRDIVFPELDDAASDGMLVKVTRRTITTEKVSEPVDFAVIRNDNRNLNSGTEVVVQEGVPGERIFSYEITLEDGVEVSRRLILEAVTVNPIPRIIECGTAKTVTTSSGQVLRYSKRLECTATAYTTEGTDDKINALGKVARVGTIAVDPKVIPLRSKVYVTSANGRWDYGVAICEDTGGGIKGNKVDLFFDTLAECYRFGRQKCVVYILE